MRLVARRTITSMCLWPCVKAVASALLERERLTYKECRAVILRAVASERDALNRNRARKTGGAP